MSSAHTLQSASAASSSATFALAAACCCAAADFSAATYSRVVGMTLMPMIVIIMVITIMTHAEHDDRAAEDEGHDDEQVLNVHRKELGKMLAIARGEAITCRQWRQEAPRPAVRQPQPPPLAACRPANPHRSRA